MWLLNAHTQELEQFLDESVVYKEYAILSHTWESEELSFHDDRARDPAVRQKKGFTKVEHACEQALADGLTYVWIDTCCIDKASSAELSEAINSMFR